MGNSIKEFTKLFIEMGTLPPNMNDTLLVLVPKIPGPKSISQFRPIGLFNVLYKLLKKKPL